MPPDDVIGTVPENILLQKSTGDIYAKNQHNIFSYFVTIPTYDSYTRQTVSEKNLLTTFIPTIQCSFKFANSKSVFKDVY